MSTLGKILLVVNLLAAGGFAYLAVQDWRGRQAIEAAGLRHLLLARGLPLAGGPDRLPPRVPASADGYNEFASTVVPFKGVGAGGVPVDSVSPELLYAYFTAAGTEGAPLAGNVPVASQEGELKRVWEVLKGELDKQDGPAAKAAAAGRYLLYLPETIEGRSEVLALIAAGNGAELTHLLDVYFHRVAPKVVEAAPLNPEAWQGLPDRLKALEAAKAAAAAAAPVAKAAADAAAAEAAMLEGTNPVAAERKRTEAFQKQQEAFAKQEEAVAREREIAHRTLRPAKDEPELRARVAHLLVHLDPSAAWQKRVMMVVGLRQYVVAVAAQAVRFRDMAARVERTISDDQIAFDDQYARLRGLAIQRTQLVRDWAERRAALEVQVQKDRDFVAQRQTQLAGLTAQLAKVKAEVDALLVAQGRTEKALYDLRKEVAETLEAVYRLDTDLAKKEQERYGAAKN